MDPQTSPFTQARRWARLVLPHAEIDDLKHPIGWRALQQIDKVHSGDHPESEAMIEAFEEHYLPFVPAAILLVLALATMVGQLLIVAGDTRPRLSVTVAALWLCLPAMAIYWALTSSHPVPVWWHAVQVVGVLAADLVLFLPALFIIRLARLRQPSSAQPWFYWPLVSSLFVLELSLLMFLCLGVALYDES